MAKIQYDRRRNATSLSRSLAILIAALGSTARAEETAQPSAPQPPVVAQPAPADAPPPVGSEVSQPAPAYPPATTTEAPQPAPWDPPPPPSMAAPVRPQRPPRPPGPSGFERRHHVGGQIGGTGLIQAVYRLRALGPFHMEVGALGADHGANFSSGAVFGWPVANRWFPYLGFGGGLMLAGGPEVVCDPMKTCPEKNGEDFAYLHARVGIGFAFGATRRNLLSLDVGGWYGRHREDWVDASNKHYTTSRMTALPMAGLSYFFAIH